MDVAGVLYSYVSAAVDGGGLLPPGHLIRPIPLIPPAATAMHEGDPLYRGSASPPSAFMRLMPMILPVAMPMSVADTVYRGGVYPRAPS